MHYFSEVLCPSFTIWPKSVFWLLGISAILFVCITDLLAHLEEIQPGWIIALNKPEAMTHHSKNPYCLAFTALLLCIIGDEKRICCLRPLKNECASHPCKRSCIINGAAHCWQNLRSFQGHWKQGVYITTGLRSWAHKNLYLWIQCSGPSNGSGDIAMMRIHVFYLLLLTTGLSSDFSQKQER